jgi:tetratricopeptide (TPR) repeat protein
VSFSAPGAKTTLVVALQIGFLLMLAGPVPGLLPSSVAQSADIEQLIANEKDPETLSGAAQQLAVSKKFDQAERLWKRALEISPRFFPALFNLGYMYFSTEQFEKAVPFLERAAEAFPGDFNTRYILGASQQKLGKRDAALRAWRKALDLQPRHLRLMQVMAVEYGAGRYFQEAAGLARRALEGMTDEPEDI